VPIFLTLSFLVDFFLDPTTCGGLGALHDLAFAGAMVQDSVQNPSEFVDFNATAFALGYASHMLLDMPAFFTPDSYLFKNFPNWLNVWYHMNFIEVYFVKQRSPTNDVPPGTLVTFFSKEIVKYQQLHPGWLPAVTEKTLTDCITNWLSFAVSTSITRSNKSNLDLFAQELVLNDPYGATTYPQAKQNLDKALGCGKQILVRWNELIFSGITPEEAQKQIVDYLTSLFQNGACLPGFSNK